MPEPQSTGSDTAVTVELFGMPRVIAGTGNVCIEGDDLRDVLTHLLYAHPELGQHVLNADGNWLNSGYTFVVDGTFSSDPEQPVTPGSEVFLVSRASGG